MRDEIERSAADSFGSTHFISRFFSEKKRNPCRGRIKDRLVSLDSFSRESLESKSRGFGALDADSRSKASKA